MLDVLFPTHLLAGVLAGRVSRLPTSWLVAGAAFPDMLDKPLAMVGPVDLFHSLGHSLFLLVVLVPAAVYSRTALAAAVGWGSHVALDALHVVVNGRPTDVLGHFWPVAVPPDPLALPPAAFVHQYVGTPAFALEVLLWVVAVALVVRNQAAREPTV